MFKISGRKAKKLLERVRELENSAEMNELYMKQLIKKKLVLELERAELKGELAYLKTKLMEKT